MSEFYIQQHQLSKRTRTIVKDEKNRDIYLMVGNWGRKRDALLLYQMNGQLIASIKQASFIFGSKFIIYENYQKVGEMRKIFNWPGDFYYIKQLHWAAHGDIYQHKYQIHHFNERIMTMDKANFLTGNYYSLDIPNEKNAPKCICIAAVMDYWLYNRSKREAKNAELNYQASLITD